MPSTTFTVRVEPEIKKRLEKLAKSTGRTRSFLAAEALNEYLDVNEWRIGGIKQAVASLDRGEGVAHKEVKDWIGSWDRKRERAVPKHRRHEYRLAARGNPRPDLAASLHRSRESRRRTEDCTPYPS